ncbi:MAG: hypothetical protein ABI405_14480 [Parafilimonas sp.]
MKKTFLCLAMFAVIFLYAFVIPDHNLAGHWISYSGDGSKINVDFNNDSTFKVSVNDETENEGKYKLIEDTFFMYDNNCGMEIPGKYKLTFYNEDSVSFSLIDDACIDRTVEVDGAAIKRIKDN